MGRTGAFLKLGRFALKFAAYFLVATFLFYLGWAVIFAISIYFGEPGAVQTKVILHESREGSSEEIWVAARLWKGTEELIAWIRTDCAIRDRPPVTTQDTIEERIYYVFVSPDQIRHHEWNIETDEPNFVIRWTDGDVEILVERDQYMRDEQNRLIGPPRGESNDTQTGDPDVPR